MAVQLRLGDALGEGELRKLAAWSRGESESARKPARERGPLWVALASCLFPTPQLGLG